MSRSKKFKFDDPQLWQMLVSVLSKMNDSQAVPSPGYRYVAEVGPGKELPGFQWKVLDHCVTTEEMDFAKFPAPNQKYFYVWENLGGASGRAFFATSTSTFCVCVIKCFFSRGGNDPKEKKKFREEARNAEFELWQKICGPGFQSRKVVVFNDRPALLMQFFSPIPVGDRSSLLPSVQDALLGDFNKRGWVHEDVKWRNIGQDKEGKVVVFDLGHVREKKETDKEWVDKAMKGLEEQCGAKGSRTDQKWNRR